MIILGGVPPAIPDPTPGAGEIIQELNALVLQQEDQTSNFNNSIHDKIAEANNLINTYIQGVVKNIDDHLALRGAVHGETKWSIGLGNKDNFRTATQDEHNNFSNVEAFVTPAGARQAIQAYLGDFSLGKYQPNGVFRMASYFNQDEYPIATPTAVQPTRYHVPQTWAPLLFNADRLIFLPKSDPNRYQRQNLYIGMQTKVPARTQADEIVNIDGQYLGTGWNQKGCDSSNGKVNFFKALADRKIYQFRTELTLPAGKRNYLLYRGYSGQIYRGVGASCSFAAEVLTIGHEFFFVDLVGTDPVMRKVVDASYMATFDQIGKQTTYAPANGTHSYKVIDFVNVPGGAVIDLVDNGVGIVVTLFWSTQDVELRLNISVPLRVTLKNGLSREISLSFTEGIVPGSLKAGGAAGYSLQGVRVRDTLDNNLMPQAGANWVKVTDPSDMNDMTQLPGVMLNSGIMIKAISGKNLVRVKSLATDFLGIEDWVMQKRDYLDIGRALTTMLAPSRHNAFGSVPERVFPISQGFEAARYLVYHLDSSTGRYTWADLEWDYSSILSTQSGNKFGIRPCQRSFPNKTLATFPTGVVTTVTLGSSSVSLNALVFTSLNGFEGRSSFGYSNRTLSVGGKLKLDALSILNLNSATFRVLANARLANPTVDDTQRDMQVQVFGIAGGRALIVITDGLNYAEAAIASYSIGSSFQLASSNNLQYFRVSPAGTVVTGKSRKSISNDHVWMRHSDIKVVVNGGSYTFILDRAFGELYGDLSFTAPNFMGGQTLTPGRMNPARLYSGTKQIDAVDEIFPSVLIPGMGGYQFDESGGVSATLMTDVVGSMQMDPYDVNEPGWVRMAAGARIILNGKVYVLDKDYPVKVVTSGVSYCYVRWTVAGLVSLSSTYKQETGNHQVLFGISRNGILEPNQDYIVLDGHVLSETREGTAIPVFIDNGGEGVNKFFSRKDLG